MNQISKQILVALCVLMLFLTPTRVLAADTHQDAGETVSTELKTSSAGSGYNGVVMSNIVLELQILDTNGNAVSGATVALQSEDNAAEADEYGKIKLYDLSPGVSYAIYVSHPGYEDWTDTFTCPDGIGGTVSMMVTLQPDGNSGNVMSDSEISKMTVDDVLRLLPYAIVIIVLLILLLILLLIREHRQTQDWQKTKEHELAHKSKEVIDIDWEAVEK